MTKNDLYQLIVVIFMCLVLFLIFDAVSVLFASLIVYFKVGSFNFSWMDVSTSFFSTGYVGGIILGIGLWLKGMLQKRKEKRSKEKN